MSHAGTIDHPARRGGESAGRFMEGFVETPPANFATTPQICFPPPQPSLARRRAIVRDDVQAAGGMSARSR
jgi:hypothetical protein